MKLFHSSSDFKIDQGKNVTFFKRSRVIISKLFIHAKNGTNIPKTFQRQSGNVPGIRTKSLVFLCSPGVFLEYSRLTTEIATVFDFPDAIGSGGCASHLCCELLYLLKKSLAHGSQTHSSYF